MYKKYATLLGTLMLFIMAIQFMVVDTASAVNRTTVVFYDNFSTGALSGEWTSGAADGHDDTIRIVDGRVEATDENNYIETQQSFTDNVIVELAVEKIGSSDMDCWDFYVELVALGEAGVIRFDTDGIDGIDVGMTNAVCGNEYSIGAVNPNKGRMILIYRDAYLKLSFINANLQTLFTDEIYVGAFDSTKIRLGLSGSPDSPRYIDSVTISSFPSTIPIPGVATFSDIFEEDTLSSQWTSGARMGNQDTITIVDGRVQATDDGNYIETQQSFTGDLVVEMDVEKVGSVNMPRWDFCIELTSLAIGGGVIRFDSDGIDGINIGVPAVVAGDRYSMNASGPNKGKAVLSYVSSYLTFSFINDDWGTLFTVPIYVGSIESTKVKIWLSGASDSPRYIDNVKIYSLAETQAVVIVAAIPNSLTADGESISQVTATVRDFYGQPLSGQDVQMTISEGEGTLGDVNDNGAGVYTALYTAPTQPGVATITVTMGNISKMVNITLTSVPEEITLVLEASPPSLPADGSSTSQITATISDSTGAPLSGQDIQMTVSEGDGTIGEVIDNGDGTYTAAYTASVQPGPETITASVGEASQTVDITLTEVVSTDRTLIIPEVTADPGEDVTVPVNITDAAGVAGGDFVVTYDDSILAVKECKTTELSSGMNLAANTATAGEIILAMSGMEGIESGSGALVDMIFTVNADAEIGKETPIEFSSADIYNENGENIDVNTQNGKVTVGSACIKGDVTGDGNVKSNDAILITRMSAGLLIPTPEQACAADVNGDGQIRSNDAIIVLRMAAGLAAPGRETIAAGSRMITVAFGKPYSEERGSVTVQVEVDNADVLAGGDICIAYDSAELRAVNVSSETDMLLASNLAEPGVVRFSFASANRLNSRIIAGITFNTHTGDVSSATLRTVQLYRPDALPIDSKVVRSLAIPPQHSVLMQNFPNPFNPETWIPYELAEDSFVIARIYDASGKLVRKLEIGRRSAGVYTTKDRAVYWDGKNSFGEEASSGIYFYALEANGFKTVKKMILEK